MLRISLSTDMFFTIERFRIYICGKWQKWPRDHVYPSFAARCFQFLSKIEYFDTSVSMKGQNFALFSHLCTNNYFKKISFLNLSIANEVVHGKRP